MERLKDESKLYDMLEKDKLTHINTRGVMKLRDDYDIFVDNREQPTAYIVQKDDWNIVYAKEDDTARKMLDELLTEPRKFSGVWKRYYELAAELADIKFKTICYLYYLPPEEFEYEEPEYKVESLREEDAEVIDYYFPYSSEDSPATERIKHRIRNYPSFTVRDEEGNPLSWALLKDDGSMGMAHTLKEYRKQGLAHAVNMELIRKVIDLGLTPFVHIVVDNYPSQSLGEQLGFKRYGKVAWFGTE